jgi:glycosyltransferase involved in cell wall biosynthesis
MENMPLVSVIITTYNRADVLRRAVLSVINQTYKNIEIIIIDDASADATREVVSAIIDPRLKYVAHHKNMGVSTARNRGIKESTGEYLAFLDDDDEWLPQKLASQLAVFKNNNLRIGLIYTNGFSERTGDNIAGPNGLSAIAYDPRKDAFFPLRLLISPPSSWILPRKIVEEVGYFDERMHNSYDDGDYFVRVAFKHGVYFLNENLVIWHASKIHLNMISVNQIKNREYFLNKYSDRIKKDKIYLYRLYKVLGKDSLLIDRAKSRKYLLKAWLMRPWDFSVISKLIGH